MTEVRVTVVRLTDLVTAFSGVAAVVAAIGSAGETMGSAVGATVVDVTVTGTGSAATVAGAVVVGVATCASSGVEEKARTAAIAVSPGRSV